MASYHTSFTYLNTNTAKDKNLLIAAFEPDNGPVETFLSMTPVTEDYYDGTKKFDYGAKYDSVAEIKITLVNRNGSDMSLAENRDLLRWLTGVRTNSWLHFYEGEVVRYSFFGRITNVQQQKMDGRVIGLIATFTSIHPWAYSALQVLNFDLDNAGFGIGEDGYIYQNAIIPPFGIDDDGIIYISNGGTDDTFDITEYGIVYKIQDTAVEIDNHTDDLYTYIYLDVEYTNTKLNSEDGTLTIKNIDLNEETSVINIYSGETIALNSGQFITSSRRDIIGDSFNFVWPRLHPGVNRISINGSASGIVTLKYRYPIKVGDCAADIQNIINNPVGCGGSGSYVPPDDPNNNFISGDMIMRIQDGKLQCSVDGVRWTDMIDTIDLAEAIGKHVEIDNEGTLVFGLRKYNKA